MTPAADLLITNGIVMTMDQHGRVIDNGAIAVRGDTIVAVDSAHVVGSMAAKETLDAAGGIIMPGLVNTHTHAAMTLFRGLADDLPLMTWLNDHIFPAEALLDEHKVHTGTLLGLRRNDPFRDHLLLRHVPVRRGRGPRRQGCRHAGGGRRGALRLPLSQLRPHSRRASTIPATDRRLAQRPAGHHRRGAALPLPVRTGPVDRAADIARKHRVPLVIHLSETARRSARHPGTLRRYAGGSPGQPGPAGGQPAGLSLRGAQRRRYRAA